MSVPHVLMETAEAEAAIRRLAQEILDRPGSVASVVLLGIQTGGVPVARHLASEMGRLSGQTVLSGDLDVSMHRDDLDHRLAPAIHSTSVPADISGKDVILVDDVLCSGRTGRAALDALTDLGRPRRVQLAVLVDRGLRELPIQADFVGKVVTSQPGDRVDVLFGDADRVVQVVMSPGPTKGILP